MTFFGRPPLRPLARAASALAALMAFPPLRPSAAAARFLRGMGPLPCGIHDEAGAGVVVQRLREQGGFVGVAHLHGSDGGADLGVSQFYVANIPNRLGFVK